MFDHLHYRSVFVDKASIVYNLLELIIDQLIQPTANMAYIYLFSCTGGVAHPGQRTSLGDQTDSTTYYRRMCNQSFYRKLRKEAPN